MTVIDVALDAGALALALLGARALDAVEVASVRVRLPLQAAHLTHLARLSRHQAVRELGLAAERARDPTLPEHERQAAVNLLQASRAAPGGMIGGGPLPEELTTQADRALRESLGGADFHRADDLAAVSEHVRRLRENAAA